MADAPSAPRETLAGSHYSSSTTSRSLTKPRGGGCLEFRPGTRRDANERESGPTSRRTRCPHRPAAGAPADGAGGEPRQRGAMRSRGRSIEADAEAHRVPAGARGSRAALGAFPRSSRRL